MAEKDLTIKMKVDSTEVDKATQKVETTKKLFEGSPITIKYDIDGKPLDVLIDKEVNLKQQTKLLYSELQKLSLAGKEQSAEFKLLSARYNDAKDNLDRVSAKSRDLFASLALIPGPIGDIAGKLNGAIGLLKTFTGFSLKDIGNQFKELNNDLNDIVKNLFGVGSSANKAKAEVADTLSTAANTGVEAANTKATTDNSKAQLGSAESKGLDVIATKKDSIATLENSLAKLEDTLATEKNTLAQQKDTIARLNATAATGDLTVMTELNTVADEQNLTIERIKTTELFKSAAAQELAAQKEALATLTTEGATAATWSFNGAIKAITSSVLFWVGVIAAAAYGVYKYIDGLAVLNKTEKEGLEIQKKSGELGLDNIALLNTLIGTVHRSDVTQREKNKAVNDYNEKLGETLGKVRTYDELTNKLITNGPKYVEYLGIKAKAEAAYALSIETTKQAIAKGAEDPTASLNWADKFIGFQFGLADSTMKKAGAKVRDTQKTELEKTSTDYFNLFIGFQKEAVALAEKLKLPIPEIKTGDKKEVKPLQDKEIIEKQKELSAEMLSLNQKDKKEKEILDLQAAKEKEEREIKALNVSKENEVYRIAALLELDVNFQKKKQEIIDKYAEEEKKKNEEFEKSKKEAANNLLEIGIKSIKNEIVRSRVERVKQYKDDKEKLDELLKDKKISQEKYNEAIINLQKGFQNDINKINDDARIKELESQKGVDESRLKTYEMNSEMSNAARLGFLNQYYDAQRKVEEDNFQIQKIKAQDNADELKRITAEHEQAKTAIAEAERAARFQIYEKGIDDLISIAAAESDIQKGLMVAKQALLAYELAMEIRKTITFATQAAARSTVAVAEGTAQTAKIGFPQNIPMLIGYAIQAAAIISAIVSAVNGAKGAASGTGGGTSTGDSFNRGKNYGDGGMINGPLHSSPQGGVQIMAEGGEAVMTRGAVTMFRPLLSMLNQAGGGTSFTNGAIGQAPYDAPESDKSVTEAPIIKTYIVENELTSIQERQSRLKSLSTL